MRREAPWASTDGKPTGRRVFSTEFKRTTVQIDDEVWHYCRGDQFNSYEPPYLDRDLWEPDS